MSIVGVAVVGAQNQPLYLRAYPPTTGGGSSSEEQREQLLLKLHFTCHVALDAVEERVLQRKVPAEASNEPYLGLLHPTLEHRVYGYLTNTSTKVMIVTDQLSQSKEENLGKMARKVYGLYVDAASNPFFELGGLVRSTRFDNMVAAVVAAYNS